MKGKLLLATACDGSMRTMVKNVAESVVCANTLQIAMGEKGGAEIAVSHKSHFDASAVKEQLGVSVTSFEKFISSARKLAARKVSNAETQEFFRNIIIPEVKLEDAVNNKVFQQVNDLFAGAGRGATLVGVKNTAWGLVNAVTEYYDHYRNTRTIDARVYGSWFGQGNDKKQEAMKQALELVS